MSKVGTYQLDLGKPYVMEFIRGQRFQLYLQWKDSAGAIQDMRTKTSKLTIRNDDETSDDLYVQLTSSVSGDGQLMHDQHGIMLNIEPQGTIKVPEGLSVFEVWLSPDEIPLLTGICHAKRRIGHA